MYESNTNYMHLIRDDEPEYEGETSQISTDDYQGRSYAQLQGSYRIMAICFYVIAIILIIAAIFL